MASPSGIHTSITQAQPISDADLQEQLDYIREHMYTRGDDLDRTIAQRRRRRRRRRRRGGRYSRMKKLTEEEVEKLFPRQTYNRWLNGGQEEDIENRGTMLQEEVDEFRQEDEVELSEQQEIELAAITSATPSTPVVPAVLGSGSGSGSAAVATSSSNTSVGKFTSVTTNVISESLSEEHLPEANLEGNTIPYTGSEVIPPESGDVELNDLSVASTSSSSAMKYKPPHEDLHFTSGTCAICLEILEDDSFVRGLVCGHVFHADCLDPWLTKRRACCPMCKRDYFYKGENNNSVTGDTRNEGQSTEGAEVAEATDAEGTVGAVGTDTGGTDLGVDFDDLDSLDLETFRNDPTLRAMIQELVPIHERVRLILRNPDYQNLGIEEEARGIANKKFSNAFKIIWWKIMGISRENMFNWAAFSIYTAHRDSRAAEARTSGTAASGTTGTNRADPTEGTTAPGNTENATRTTTTGQTTGGTTTPGTSSQDIVSERV